MRIVRTAVLLPALTACHPIRHNDLASVDPETRSPIAYFLDQSYVSKPKSPPRLLYEGQPAANIVLSQNLERAGSSVRRDTSGAWYKAHAVVLTPLFVIRQLVDSSAAVPPPSFMPKLTGQAFLLRKELRNVAMPSDPVERERHMRNPRNWTRAHLIIGDFIFGHHSNGQAGCFYVQQRFEPRPGAARDYVCVWNNADSTTDRTINYAQGSFSTWYLRAGLGYEVMGVFQGDAAIPAHRAGALVSIHYHLPFMTEDPQKPLYGDTRLRIVSEYAWRFRPRPVPSLGAMTLRVAGTGDWALNAGAGIPNAQRSVEAALTSERFFGFGLFVRRYSGQDYYNINFTKRLNVTQVGVTIRYERPQAFVP